MKARGLLVISCAFAHVSLIQFAAAAPIYWDGAATGGWDVVGNWSSDAAGTTDPAAVPGLNDVATFNTTGANTAAATISLNGDRQVQGLNADSAGIITLLGGGGTRTLSIGSGGITSSAPVTTPAFAGARNLVIGHDTIAADMVNVQLTADQRWLFNGGNVGGYGIMVKNSVSVSDNSTRTLTLGGTSGSSSISVISGVISDGVAGGKLNITLGTGDAASSSANRWNLTGNNTYTGVTTIRTGGLGISHVNALGATGASSGTSVLSGASLFIRTDIGNIAAESLTIAGLGISNLGALRNVLGTTNTWTGTIAANATSGNVGIGSDTGQTLTLSNTADITTTGTNLLVFTANGSSGSSVINVNGEISGSAGVAKGGSVANSFVNLGGDSKTYTGLTAVNIGTLSVNTALTSTSAVSVGPGTGTNTATLRGNNGSINTSAVVTVNATGTLAPGATGNTIGTLSMGGLTFVSGGTLAIDINSGTLAKDLVNITNLTINSGAILAINDLGSSSIPVGTALLFLQNSDTWNPADGFFTVNGQLIQDESTTFQSGNNTFQINYDYSGIEGNGVALIAVVPEPATAALAACGVAVMSFRRRRKK